MEVMDIEDEEDEEAALRLHYGHSDIIQDSSCSNMPTSHETSVYLPAHYSGDNIPTQIIKCEDGHSKTMQEDIMLIQKAHCSGDNITTQMIKCEDGHSKAIQEDIMCIQRSKIIDVHVNTETQNVTVEEQQHGLNGLECSTSFTNTYNMPTSTYNASEFVEVKQDPDRDSDPGEFDGVSEKTRQWIVDEDGLLKEVKTEPTNWVDETHNCTATSDSDSKVHKRRYTGQRLVCGSMYISDNFPPHNPLLHIYPHTTVPSSSSGAFTLVLVRYLIPMIFIDT